jgi:methylglyoxal synthase
MLEWAEYNLDLLAGHELFATATTGHLLQQQLGLPVTCFRAARAAGADFMISSPLIGQDHQRRDPAAVQARHNQAALRVARAG